jgi:hypothetical protein
MKKNKVHIDKDNRIYFGKMAKQIKKLSENFRVYIEKGKVILEPIVEMPTHWLDLPENKHLKSKLAEAIKHAKEHPEKRISYDDLKKELGIKDEDFDEEE